MSEAEKFGKNLLLGNEIFPQNTFSLQVLCDSKLYEIIRANFERAELLSVVRTTVNSRVNLYYLLSHYSELTFQ